MQPEIEMTDTPAAPAPEKKRRKATRRKRRPVAAAAAKRSTAEFPGLAAKDCCETCQPDFCVISGAAVCGHPLKGGLQPSLLRDANTMARFNRAKKVLGKAKIDLRTA